jgi:5-methylcytosine-specific restriction endonuclease McrA
VKQRKPIERKTPLKSTGGLKRTSSPKSSSGPTKPKRQRDTGPKRAVRDEVKKRASYGCEICGRWLGEHDGEIHHRHGRQIGGTRRAWINWLTNLVYLCQPCHRMVTDTKGNRAVYEDNGWLVREGIDPADAAVEVAFLGRRFLGIKGGYQFEPDKKREEAV